MNNDQTILGALNQNQDQQAQLSQILEPLKKVYNTVRMAQNPNLAFQQMLKNNPQLYQRMQEISQFISQTNGNPEQAFYMLAKQKGIDPETILSALR